MSGLITTMVSCAVAAMYTQHAFNATRTPRTRALWRRLRWRHLGWAVVVFTGVVVLGTAVYSALPPLRWGWWSALGGQGSVVFATSAPATSTPLPIWLQLLPLWMVAMLLLAMPRLVLWEERAFRRGAERFNPQTRITTPLRFGILHAVMGIPLAFALALSLTGWALQRRYLRTWVRGGRAGAMREASACHLAYNTLILALVLLPALLLAIGG